MSELPKIDSIVEKPAPPTSATAQLLQQHLAADLEVDLERLTLEVARPPQVSQVSKLLAAFSTWTSVPALNSSSKEIPAAAPQDSRSRKDENLEEVGGASDSESKVVSGAAEGSKDPGVFLPPVDSVNVSQVQRRLFLSQLKKHLSGVCSKLGLTFHVVLPRVTATASKFRQVNLQVCIRGCEMGCGTFIPMCLYQCCCCFFKGFCIVFGYTAFLP